jgi:hypothetical protein
VTRRPRRISYVDGRRLRRAILAPRIGRTFVSYGREFEEHLDRIARLLPRHREAARVTVYKLLGMGYRDPRFLERCAALGLDLQLDNASLRSARHNP